MFFNHFRSFILFVLIFIGINFINSNIAFAAVTDTNTTADSAMYNYYKSHGTLVGFSYDCTGYTINSVIHVDSLPCSYIAFSLSSGTILSIVYDDTSIATINSAVVSSNSLVYLAVIPCKPCSLRFFKNGAYPNKVIQIDNFYFCNTNTDTTGSVLLPGVPVDTKLTEFQLECITIGVIVCILVLAIFVCFLFYIFYRGWK